MSLSASPELSATTRGRQLAGAGLLLATGAALATWTWGTWPDVLVDFGRELYVPWRLVEGDLLYHELAYFNGPLSPYWNALWFGVFGVGLSTLVGVNLVLLALATALLHRLLERISDRNTATIACFVFLVVFAFAQLIRTGNYNWVTPYSHEATHGLLLGLAALASLDAFARRGKTGWMAGAGGLLGLAFLTQAAVFVAAASAAGVMAVGLLATCPAARTPRPWLAFAAGVALPIAAAFTWLATAMPIETAWRGTVGAWPAILTGDVAGLFFYERISGLDRPAAGLAWIGTWMLRYTAALLALIGLAFATRGPRFAGRGAAIAAFTLGVAALAGMRTLTWLLALAPLPVFVALAAASRLSEFRRPGDAGPAAALALGFATLSFVLLARMFLHARAYHYGFTLAAPATMLSIVALMGWLPRWLEARGANARVFRSAALGLIAVACVAHLQITAGYLAKKNTRVAAGRDAFRADKRGDYVNEALGHLRARRPGTLAVLPEGIMLNYLSRRAAPTRHLNFMPPELALFGGEASIGAELAASPPDLALVVHKDLSEYGYRYFGDDYAADLHGWLLENYRTVVTISRSPLTPGKKFGIALLEANLEPEVHSTGSR